MTSETTTSGRQPALPEIHGYRLQGVLGHGGMSTVYLARQVSLDRDVALKVMLPGALTDEVSRRRFENEARTIARLDHPNIVRIFEVGRTRDGLPYYAMPHLSRGHLGQRKLHADPARARTILHGLLSALEYAHTHGVVHRDVKAENVLFDESERPLLADFGIALRRGYGTRVTTAGLAVGSTAYMPPEQARGHNVDGRADLYSVGVLAWEMLAGRLPYNAGDALSMALQHAQEPIPRLPPELRHWQKFFDRALAKTPEARFANAAEMRAALDRVPERGSGLQQPGGSPRLPLRRAAAVLVVLAAAAGLGLWLMDDRPADPPEAGTTTDAATATLATTSTNDPALASLMRPLPESPAERWITAAERQISAQRWTRPEGDNAYDSLIVAAREDAGHPRLMPSVTALIAALSQQAVKALRQGDIDPADDAVQRARMLAASIAQPAGNSEAIANALARMDADISKALDTRMTAAAEELDRKAADRVLAQARQLNLDEAAQRRLSTAAAAVSSDTSTSRHSPNWRVIAGSNGRVAVAGTPVSRGDYARFVDTTGRQSTLCRERGSVLRLFARRDWKSPGFEQTAQQPVVCVSWRDAQAYAQWLGKRDGQRYRLARIDEVRAIPATAGPKPTASWTDACGNDCGSRVATGQSWRGGPDRRVLRSDRGYDDVGLRLARDL